MPKNLKVKIFKLLLDAEEPLWLNKIARQLACQSSHVNYHVKSLTEKGIIIREENEKETIYYPNPFFEQENILPLLKVLDKIQEKHDLSDAQIANCIEMLLELEYY